MTDEEMAEEYAVENWEHCEEGQTNYKALKLAFLAGLKAGKEGYSKIYMLGRKDERERPCFLCSNPRSICVRCERYRKLCDGSDIGVYIGGCEDFIYKEVSDD